MTMRPALLAFASFLLLLPACASTSRTQARAPSLDTPTERREEIERLSQEISILRDKAGMSAPASMEDSYDEGSGEEATPSTQPSGPDTERRTRRTCKDVCKISASICKNAEAICQLAEELAPDPWADETCRGAEASCEDSRSRCQAC